LADLLDFNRFLRKIVGPLAHDGEIAPWIKRFEVQDLKGEPS